MISVFSSRARRLLSRRLWRSARRVLPALVLVASGAGAQAEITRADYSAPTPRYAHGVLGDAIEYGSLVLQLGTTTRVFVLPDDRVFEDIAPRLVDVDGDGDKEVIVVESQNQTGAQLAIYDETGKIAATPHIGTRNRWLAPIGAADLDGDGFVEIAYIDRPHLAKTLRLWRFQDGALTQVAQLAGLTNHRIGEDFISGGLRTCGDVPELIVATANWQRMQAVRFDGTRLTAEDIGPFTGQAGFRRALSCS